jgi:hypothetical protein
VIQRHFAVAGSCMNADNSRDQGVEPVQVAIQLAGGLSEAVVEESLNMGSHSVLVGKELMCVRILPSCHAPRRVIVHVE